MAQRRPKRTRHGTGAILEPLGRGESAPVRYREGNFPPEARLDWPKLVPLIGPAAAAVARYDGMLSAVPNADVLLSPLTIREAVLSSRIEGTQATMGEVLEFEAGQEPRLPERRDDIREILNYRAAMRHAEEMLQTLPLSQRVVREAHRILMSGVRGESKSPGNYRRLQNYIGSPGYGIEKAEFVPIGADKLPDGMSAWERYIHNEAPDRLVQLAVLHAEFEALHPFLDGNGRLGRMLIPLFLWQHGLIRKPVFYISAYLEARRDAYYEGLRAVSRDDDWTGWCRFFLEAVKEQAEENLTKAKAILELYEDMKRRIPNLTNSRYAIHTLDWIFARPIFRGADFAASTDLAPRTARRILETLCEGKVLQIFSPGGGRRPAIFVFPSLLNAAESEKVF